MRPRVDELEAIIRRRICTVCTDRDVNGACGLEGAETCSLFDLFPLVVQAIVATDSDEIGPYIQAIRENVCAVCIDQALDGTCPRRGVRCALDAYLLPIVESIEEATGKSFPREKVPQGSGH